MRRIIPPEWLERLARHIRADIEAREDLVRRFCDVPYVVERIRAANPSLTGELEPIVAELTEAIRENPRSRRVRAALGELDQLEERAKAILPAAKPERSKTKPRPNQAARATVVDQKEANARRQQARVLFARGLTPKEIAGELGVADRTARRYVEDLPRKRPDN